MHIVEHGLGRENPVQPAALCFVLMEVSPMALMRLIVVMQFLVGSLPNWGYDSSGYTLS